MRPVRALAALCLVPLVATGCKTIQPTSGDLAQGELPSDFGRHRAADVLARLAAADTLTGLAGAASLAVQSPQMTDTYDATLAAASTGHAFLEVGKLGFVGARVLARPDSAFVHNVLQRELLVVDARRAPEVLPIPLSSADLFDVLAGTLRPADAATYTLSTDTRNGYYLLRSPDGRRVLSVDPRVWRLARAVRYETAGGGVAEEILWTNYRTSGGAVLPGRVTVRQPGSRTQAVLLLSGVRPAAPSIPARLSVPAGTARRSL